MVDDISLAKATALEKTNYALDKFIQYAQSNDNFVMEEGIFRVPGVAPQIDDLFQRMSADPTAVNLQDEKIFIQFPHNVTGLLKRFMMSNNVQWSDEAAQIMKNELKSQQFDFEKVIKQFLEKNYLEEAKMLHNILYIGQLFSLQADYNKMPAHNMFQTFAPWLNNMGKGDMQLELDLAKAAIVATTKKTDAMGLHKQDSGGKPIYGKTFDETYPQAAEKIFQQHQEIPNRQVRQEAKPQVSSGINLRSFINPAIDWLTQIALPTVKKFFNKTVPNLLKRIIGKKAKGTTIKQSQSNNDEIGAKLSKTQEEVKAPEAVPWKTAIHQQTQRSEVNVEVKQDLPPQIPPRTVTQSQTQLVPILPTLQHEEQSPKKKAFSFFKQREKLGNTDPIPKFSTLESEEAKYTQVEKQKGLDHFKGLLDKKLSDPPKKPRGKM
ncbi:MAG TPA: hypothetical protein PLD88_01425 [Candidatus Berkiella sp.]|nr:hypothetical protein [Candidatus Berkiella sp.]